MNITRVVRFLLLVIATCAVLLISKQARSDGWPTNYQHFKVIRELAQTLPRGTHVMFTLTNGDLVFGELLKYEKYTDYIWYQPQNTSTIWAQDAFDVHELLSIQVVVQEPI